MYSQKTTWMCIKAWYSYLALPLDHALYLPLLLTSS